MLRRISPIGRFLEREGSKGAPKLFIMEELRLFRIGGCDQPENDVCDLDLGFFWNVRADGHSR